MTSKVEQSHLVDENLLQLVDQILQQDGSLEQLLVPESQKYEQTNEQQRERSETIAANFYPICNNSTIAMFPSSKLDSSNKVESPFLRQEQIDVNSTKCQSTVVNNLSKQVDKVDEQHDMLANSSPAFQDLLETIKSVRHGAEVAPSANEITVAQFQIALEDACSVLVDRKLKKIAVGRECSQIVLWDFDLADELRWCSLRAKRFAVLGLDAIRLPCDQYNGLASESGLCEPQAQPHVDGEEEARLEPMLLHGHSGAVYELAAMQGGNLLLSCSADSTIKSWHTQNGRPADTYRATQAPVYTLHSTGKSPLTFISGAGDGCAHLWDVHRTVPFRLFSTRPAGTSGCSGLAEVCSVRYHPSGNYFSSANTAGQVTIWDVRARRAVRHMKLHSAATTSSSFTKLHFSRDGRLLCATGGGPCLTMFDLTATSRGQINVSTGGHLMRSVAFAPKHHLLAACGPNEPSVFIWNNALSFTSQATSGSSKSMGMQSSTPVRLESSCERTSFMSLRFVADNLVLATSKLRSKSMQYSVEPTGPKQTQACGKTLLIGPKTRRANTTLVSPFDESTDEDCYEFN